MDASEIRCLELGKGLNRLDEITTEGDPSKMREGDVGDFSNNLAILSTPLLLIDVRRLSSSTFHSLNALIANLN